MGAKKFKFGVSKGITLVNEANEKAGFSKAKAAAWTGAMGWHRIGSKMNARKQV